MVIVLSSGQEVLFHVKETSPMQLKAKLAGAVSNAKQGQPVASPATNQSQGSVADELTKLASLKQQGVITQAEFDNKKAQLLQG
jgi:membrane protease subunit (stomatin/prohibitin family)